MLRKDRPQASLPPPPPPKPQASLVRHNNITRGKLQSVQGDYLKALTSDFAILFTNWCNMKSNSWKKYGLISHENHNHIIDGFKHCVLVIIPWSFYRSNTTTIRHINCTTWDDHTAPSDTAAAMEIMKEISKCGSDRPILVHCSAGVGRTCTLIGERYVYDY